MEDNFFGIPSTVFGSQEWMELEKNEFELGPEQLLQAITSKKTWSNQEILWVLKRLIYYYGKKDALLKKAPPERLMLNMVDVLRAFYVIFDISDPELDENLRSYVCTKLTDAAWGISSPTREYLYKIK
ncbi:hypothetical protein [Syntrophomonas curvata]